MTHIILTGEKNVGKTTVVKRVVTALRERGLRPAGFYTDGGPETLYLVPVGPGNRIEFGSRSHDYPGDVSVGRYAINPAAIEVGLTASRADGDVVIVDEIGRMERRGDGFAPLLAELDPASDRGILLSVRKSVVPFVERSFPQPGTVRRLEVTESNREQLPTTILDLLIDERD